MQKELFGKIRSLEKTIDQSFINYYENGIVYVLDLIFECDNKQSYGLYRQKGLKTDFLTWTGLRISVPKERTQVV